MKDFFSRYADRIRLAGDAECWLWTGAQAAGGYGHTHRNGEHVYAHRAAFECANGIGSSDGWVIRHKCDNPPCCNPAHLLSGTYADNAADCAERGRTNPAKGEAIWTAQLTEADVLLMRQMSREGQTIAAIQALFPVTAVSISLALRGSTWAHLPGAVADPPTANRKLSESDVRQIKRRLAIGERGSALAAHYAVKRATISAIKTGRNWSHVGV